MSGQGTDQMVGKQDAEHNAGKYYGKKHDSCNKNGIIDTTVGNQTEKVPVYIGYGILHHKVFLPR